MKEGLLGAQQHVGPSGRGRRFFIGLGCAHPGPDSKLRALAGVVPDLVRMRDLFVHRLGFEQVVLRPAELATQEAPANLDLSATEIHEGLHAWRVRAGIKPEDSVVLYFSGHGYTHGSVHYLCTRGFHAENPSSGLETRRLATLLPQTVGRLWVILDICRAGDGACALCEAVIRDRASFRGSVWVLAACGQAAALDQAFSAAFVSAADPFVRAGGCPSHDALARRVQKALGGDRAVQRLQQSSYGAESFAFFGCALQSGVNEGARRPGPTSLLSLLGLLYRSHPGRLGPPARELAPAVDSAAALASAPRTNAEVSPLAIGARRSWPALLLATCALGALALLLRVGARQAREQAAQPVAPFAQPTSARVFFAAGRARLATSVTEARAAYATCVAQGLCLMPFASSTFAAEARPVPDLPVQQFAIGRFEVSNREFRAWLERSGSTPELVQTHDGKRAQVRDESGRVLAALVLTRDASAESAIRYEGGAFLVDPARAAEPVTGVTWYGAQAYCQSVGGRLPTEAEWALAARGPQARTFPWGERPASNCQSVAFGRSIDRECSALPLQPAPSGTALEDVTPEGVHDLGGNVSEWTATLFTDDSAQHVHTGCTPDRLAAGGCRVVRGGSFWDSGLYLRGTARSALDANAYWRGLGIRCAWDTQAH